MPGALRSRTSFESASSPSVQIPSFRPGSTVETSNALKEISKTPPLFALIALRLLRIFSMKRLLCLLLLLAQLLLPGSSGSDDALHYALLDYCQTRSLEPQQCAQAAANAAASVWALAWLPGQRATLEAEGVDLAQALAEAAMFSLGVCPMAGVLLVEVPPSVQSSPLSKH